MSRQMLRLPSLLAPLCLLSLSLACGDDQGGGEEGASTTMMSSTGSDTSTGTTSDTNDSTDMTDTDMTDTDDPMPTSDTADFISEEGPETGDTDAMPGNLGDQCMSDSDCAEDLFCNGIAGFGGICSECASDDDCPDGGNCTIGENGWFACGDGSLGQMCESDASCGEGLFCAELLDVGGLINTNFCSECAEDIHCENGQLCAPELDFMDFMNISGQRACIDPGTLAQDSLCDADGSGDEQCEGFCTVASFMGFIELGVCGQCESDADCMGGSCQEAMVGLEGFAGSTCM